MAVTDGTVYLIIGFMFIYLVLYQRNRLFGNIGYISIAMAGYVTSTDNTQLAICLVMLVGAIINTIYDLIYRKA